MADDRDEGRVLLSTKKTSSDDIMMSRRTLKWTSVRSPATSMGDALQEALHNNSSLDDGLRVIKVTTRGNFKHRLVTLSQDKYSLFITHQSLQTKNKTATLLARKLPLPMISRKGVVGFTNGQNLRDRYVRYIDVADLDYVSWGVVGTQKLESARSSSSRLKGKDAVVDRQRDAIVTVGHHGNQTLDVLVRHEKERHELIQCVQAMMDTYRERKKYVSNEALLLRYIWYDVDLNQDGEIGESEFVKILSRINFHVKNASKKFKSFLKSKKNGEESGGGLSYPDVMELLQNLKSENGVSPTDQIWNDVFGKHENLVTATDFLEKFMHGVQGDSSSTMEDVELLFAEINEMEINNKNEPTNIIFNRHISRERFTVLLHHELNSAYDPLATEMDSAGSLTEPMSHYWINTSHNTYLTGDQLQSTSSVEMYLKALRRGCKCLELDCWDGENRSGSANLAVVFHGHTLTSKILFADIIRVVKSYVDQHQDTYPIILSLENHCSHPFQRQMAKDMMEILGPLLYVPGVSMSGDLLPSPEQLRGMVVIKGKRPPEPDDEVEDDATEQDEEDPYEAGDATPTSSPKQSSLRKGGKQKDAKPPKIVKELARLTLFHGAKFKTFGNSILAAPSHMHSIGETKISKILSKSLANCSQWREYNVDHMTRTYPAGARVDSSNYNPVLAWALGCQLVALNFQTSDAPLLLNDGLFRQGGGCGYVAKPRSIMHKADSGVEVVAHAASDEGVSKDVGAPDDDDAVETPGSRFACGVLTPASDTAADPPAGPPPVRNDIKVADHMKAFEMSRKKKVPPIRLRIRVISGSCLPKPKGEKTGETIDPYVIITLHDVTKQSDGKLTNESSSHTTSTVSDNGFCPVWNESKAKEFIVNKPQFAMLQFSLNEKDIALSDRVADAVIPVSLLRKGYRSIQLYDHHGTRSGAFGFATLLVEIQRYEIA